MTASHLVSPKIFRDERTAALQEGLETGPARSVTAAQRHPAPPEGDKAEAGEMPN